MQCILRKSFPDASLVDTIDGNLERVDIKLDLEQSSLLILTPKQEEMEIQACLRINPNAEMTVRYCNTALEAVGRPKMAEAFAIAENVNIWVWWLKSKIK
jgi:hypothetical protein